MIDPFVSLWALGLCGLVAAAFAWNVIRGLRTGRIRVRYGYVDRARFPGVFWLAVAIYVVGGAVILATAFVIVWGPLLRR